jgi:hypothetical protein
VLWNIHLRPTYKHFKHGLSILIRSYMYYKLCQTQSTYFLYDKVFLRKSISLSSGVTRKGRARGKIIVMAPLHNYIFLFEGILFSSFQALA